jgi:hypothetical protein
MNDFGTPRAADLAAQQVEQIVQAAEQAADRIKEEAGAEARREALRELESARKEAKDRLEEAEKESAQIREQTMRAVEGRVAAAENAAAEVLEDARSLHSGMRRLGEALNEQAERMLRDVQAAHRQMQASLRVAPDLETGPRARSRASSEEVSDDRPSRAAARPARDEPPRERRPARAEPPTPRGADASESERIIAAAEAARAEAERPPRRRSANPFDDLDVPSWVGRDR